MAIPSIGLMSLSFGVSLASRSRRPLVQAVPIAAVATMTVLLVLHPSWRWPLLWILCIERSVAVGVVLLALASLVTLIRRLRTPLVLRLTHAGIERSGYTRPTPPIPYAAIVRIDTLSGRALGLTLRDGLARPGLGRTLRGYDVAIGHDVGARIPELRERIAARLPDDAVVHTGD